MFRHRKFRRSSLLVAASMLCVASAHAAADELLRLWGLDAADGKLFAIDDVNNPHATFSDYGPLHVVEEYRARPIGANIRGFTIVNTFDAYAVVNGDVGGHTGPVLVHVDLRGVDTGVPVVADVIGSIGGDAQQPGWTVTGIAGDPLFSVMYVLLSDDDPATDDRIVRAHADITRRIHTESLGPISWRYGGVRMGADIALGPAGLLLVADAAEGRIVMVDPESGEVRGVRLEGIRVDTDTAHYAGIAWDGYNDRTAMFDRRTGQLIIDDRTNNTIIAFDLQKLNIREAEGLEFVFRSDPPGEGAGTGGSDMRHVSNIAGREPGGSRGGIRGGGSGGGGSPPFDLSSLFDDPPIDENEKPLADGSTGDDPFDDLDSSFDGARNPPPGGGTTDDPFDPPGNDGDTPVVPVPGSGLIVATGLMLAAGRRRR